MSDERTGLYLQEYLAVHNTAIQNDPCSRPDMTFPQVMANGHLVMSTRDKVQTSADKRVFDRILARVERSYRLIVP